MAQEKVTVSIAQIQRDERGMIISGGQPDIDRFVYKTGNYDETIAVLKAAGFERVDRVQDALDRASEA